jgi:pimeloyl-ACP methyl ester carboxylesterase
LSIIEEDGPYDGIIGFSQGAALAASMLLCSEYSRENYGLVHEGGPEFKLAIFFNAVMLFSPSESVGCNIGKEIQMQEERLAGFLQGEDSSESSPSESPGFYAETRRSSYFEAGDNGLDISPNIFGFIPETFPARISIPTLHVIGMKDQFSEHSRVLVKLCEPDKTHVLFIDCGHELPRTENALDRCAELFEKAVMAASLGGA